MKLVACVTVRMSSERLPGKVMADVCGRPALARVVDRYEQVGGLDDLVVATSVHPDDDEVAYWCKGAGVRCHRGSLDDVCERIYDACAPLQPDYVLRGLGDCPFIEPRLLEMMVDVVSLHCADAGRIYTSPYSWPVYGAAESPYSWGAVTRMYVSSSGSQREHFGTYLDSHRSQFTVIYPVPPPGYYATYYRPYRLELDTDADLWLMRRVYEALGTDREPPLHEVVRFLDAHPALAVANASVPEKTGPLTSFTLEERKAWSAQMEGAVVDWGGACDWLKASGHRGTAVWCSSGDCYLGYVQRKGRGEHDVLVRPDGSRIIGDAELACPCGAGRTWERR